MHEIRYARLSSLAVTSALSGALASIGLLLPPAAFLSIIGIISGGAALWIIRRYEFAGRRLAKLGMIMSVGFGLATPTLQWIQFHSEAPNGYLRLNFPKLVRNARSDQSGPPLLPLDQYDGELVCVKGYAVLSTLKRNNRSFWLSPDGGEDDMRRVIIVELSEGQDLDWSPAVFDAFAISGAIEMNDRAIRDKSFPRYKLTRPIIRMSVTPYGVAGGRGGKKC